MKITITHSDTEAYITSKTGKLKIQPIQVKTNSNRQAIKTALFMVFTQFVSVDKRVIIEIKPKMK